MGFDSIIALDLGKFKSVAAVMDATTRRHAFATLDTTPQALHDLLVSAKCQGSATSINPLRDVRASTRCSE